MMLADDDKLEKRRGRSRLSICMRAGLPPTGTRTGGKNELKGIP